jgi:hypothetical protein
VLTRRALADPEVRRVGGKDDLVERRSAVEDHSPSHRARERVPVEIAEFRPRGRDERRVGPRQRRARIGTERDPGVDRGARADERIVRAYDDAVLEEDTDQGESRGRPHVVRAGLERESEDRDRPARDAAERGVEQLDDAARPLPVHCRCCIEHRRPDAALDRERPERVDVLRKTASAEPDAGAEVADDGRSGAGHRRETAVEMDPGHDARLVETRHRFAEDRRSRC